MTRPQQPAARARWATRLEAIGLALDSIVQRRGPVDDRGEHRVHLSGVARVAMIPESSLRTIADEAFTEIRVPGWVVGYRANRFYLAPAERPIPRPKTPHIQRNPPCGGDPSCKTHRGGEFGADSARECRR